MPRTLRNAKLDSRSARAKLAARREPYWTVISAGCAVGYRKGRSGGTWVARFRDETGRQHYEAIGATDDARDANDQDVLSYAQAQARARAWFDRKAAAADDPDEDERKEGPYTVADAMADYLDWFGKHRKGLAFTRAAVNAFILPKLGKLDARKLTRRRIEAWLHELAESPARLRTRKGAPQRFRDAGDDPEAPRRRRSTANRVLAILKAGLNHALKARRIATDDAWRYVQRFSEVDAARPRYLTDDEARRLVNACEPAFRPMVQAALLTGMRYGELAALRVCDFNPDAGTLQVRASKSGKSRHVHLTDEGRDFCNAAALGKAGDALLLPRPDGKAWAKSHQQRPVADACIKAKICPAVSFHALRHTYASRLAMKGVPLFVVATQLGHRDTRMVEHHYGHLAPSYVAETVRAAFGSLGIIEQSNVSGIR